MKLILSTEEAVETLESYFNIRKGLVADIEIKDQKETEGKIRLDFFELREFIKEMEILKNSDGHVKIPLIKLVRTYTYASLLDSKKFVEDFLMDEK